LAQTSYFTCAEKKYPFESTQIIKSNRFNSDAGVSLNVFRRRATGFHRQAKLILELNFFMKKPFC